VRSLKKITWKSTSYLEDLVYSEKGKQSADFWSPVVESDVDS
jgi:hypothetical protein